MPKWVSRGLPPTHVPEPGSNMNDNLELSGDAELPDEVPRADVEPEEPRNDGTASGESAQVWVAAFLIAIAGLIAYSNAFRVPFHAEDREVIVENVALHAITTFPQALEISPSQTQGANCAHILENAK